MVCDERSQTFTTNVATRMVRKDPSTVGKESWSTIADTVGACSANNFHVIANL